VIAQTLIFNRAGLKAVEIKPRWESIAWRLGQVGEGKFFLPYSDPQCTPDNLAFGNRVLVQFDSGLPAFGGVIDVPRRPVADGITIGVFEAARILSWRETLETAEYNAVPGTIFRDLIEQANITWPTGIVAGAIYTGGTAREETFHYQEILGIILNLARLSGHEWQIAPNYISGKLTFMAHWAVQIGTDLSDRVALIEDRNIQNVMLDEQGPIANAIHAPGGGAGGTTWDDRNIGSAFDTDSRDLYDLREYTEIQTAVFGQTTLDASAAALLTSLKNPRKHFSMQALDKDPGRFVAYDIGDQVHLEAFVGWPAWAFDGTVRIEGREWLPDGTCRLEAVEW